MSVPTATAPVSPAQQEAIFDSAHENRPEDMIHFNTKTASEPQQNMVFLPPAKRKYYYDYVVDEAEKEAAHQFFTSADFIELSERISHKAD